MSGALPLLAALALFNPIARCSPRPAPIAAPVPLQVAAHGGSAATALYRAPSTYREPGRPARNSVIITSQPVHVGQQHNPEAGGAGTSADEAPQPPPSTSDSGPAPATWRRQLFVRTTLGTGGSPVVAIDCADGKSCSTTIPVRPPAATHSPTFKPYSQEVLDKFLSDYATVTTAGNSSDPLGGKELLLQLQHQQQMRQQQGLAGESASSLTASSDGTEIEPTNRLANLYLDENGDNNDNSTDDKSKSVQWSLLKSQHHKHPYDDHKGWVTLEPVPWSSSHVSKWQSNVQPGRPWDNIPSPGSWHNDIEQRPSGSFPPPHHGPGPGHGHGPNSGYHHGQSTQNFNGNGNGNWASGGGGGSNAPSRPSSSWADSPGGWDRDRPGPNQDYRPDRPPTRPSWESQSQRPNKWDRPSQGPSQGPSDQWVSSADPDIITDNSPPDFPSHPSQQGPNRPGASYSYGPGPSAQQSAPSRQPWGGDRPHREPSRHPPTHPEEGDGTWVLLSSTKGYSTPPRGRLPHQRALTVSTHRSVRLTVLPPENGTNMTTSHGGLLEVEDTQHTVDESQRLHAASLLKQALDQHHNATLSSYETLVREATRVHEAELLKQALADRRLANATALSPELLQLHQQLQQQQHADKRADNVTAHVAAPVAAPVVAPGVAPTKTKTGKSRTRIKIEPMPSSRPHHADDAPNFTGRGEGMAVKVVRPSTPSRRSMALAAVGAGLLPATMAMLVPIMLGKRRRRSAEEDDGKVQAKAEAKAETAPSYLAYAPYGLQQPLEAEDSPPRVIDFASSSTWSSTWSRPRRRREAAVRQHPRGPGSVSGTRGGSRI